MSDHVFGKGMQRADLAKLTGCNLETIRYYEKIGMMPDPPRSASGYRIYGEDHVSRLRFILRGRELGFSLDEVRGLLALVEGGAQTCAEVKERTERHLADVRAKIAAGASLMQFYTGMIYRGPALIGECVEALRAAGT